MAGEKAAAIICAAYLIAAGLLGRLAYRLLKIDPEQECPCAEQ